MHLFFPNCKNKAGSSDNDMQFTVASKMKCSHIFWDFLPENVVITRCAVTAAWMHTNDGYATVIIGRSMQTRLNSFQRIIQSIDKDSVKLHLARSRGTQTRCYLDNLKWFIIIYLNWLYSTWRTIVNTSCHKMQKYSANSFLNHVDVYFEVVLATLNTPSNQDLRK